MGRWTDHPMGSDRSYDARDSFMMDLDITDYKGDIEKFYFERSREEIAEFLKSLSLAELEGMAERVIVNKNKFVIPYIFIQYGVRPTDPEIRKFLRNCLDCTEELKDEGEKVLKHIKFFKDNFDTVMDGKMFLENDSELLSIVGDHLKKRYKR